MNEPNYGENTNKPNYGEDMTAKTKRLYMFRQNNSGGEWEEDDNVGQYVFIEAYDCDHANRRAEEIGIYFDGVEKGMDCECCGDRWYRVDESDAMAYKLHLL